MEKNEMLLRRISCVAVFKNVLETPVLKCLIKFLKSDGEKRYKKYAAFVGALYDEGCDLGKYLKKQLFCDENSFVMLKAQGKQVPLCMENAVQSELEFFSSLSKLKVSDLLSEKEAEILPGFENTAYDFKKEYAEKISRLNKDGYGIYSVYTMFNLSAEGKIQPVKSPDITEISDLFGYEREREIVISNTKRLLQGKPAQNILLCGAAGTGKSSTVKAVTNLLKGEGVRLIEVQKEQLQLLPKVMEEICKNPLKFIIFIDDLSFNNSEEGFGTLKAILEGSAGAKASNAVIYATSNRRHIVKETFSDRDGDDIHRGDTMAELLSLSERFGLTVYFDKPNKLLYLDIVYALCEKYGVNIEKEELDVKAEAFALRKGSRSARCAKQFVESQILDVRC